MYFTFNSSPHATITATLLTPAQRYTADQLDSHFWSRAAALYSVQETSTRKNKKAVLSQGNRAMPQLFFSV